MEVKKRITKIFGYCLFTRKQYQKMDTTQTTQITQTKMYTAIDVSNMVPTPVPIISVPVPEILKPKILTTAATTAKPNKEISFEQAVDLITDIWAKLSTKKSIEWAIKVEELKANGMLKS